MCYRNKHTSDMAHFCGAILTHFGTEAIKENLPKEKTCCGVWDISRIYGLRWISVKKCITLNLNSVEGKELFTELICSSDVFLENYRSNAMARVLRVMAFRVTNRLLTTNRRSSQVTFTY